MEQFPKALTSLFDICCTYLLSSQLCFVAGIASVFILNEIGVTVGIIAVGTAVIDAAVVIEEEEIGVVSSDVNFTEAGVVDEKVLLETCSHRGSLSTDIE